MVEYLYRGAGREQLVEELQNRAIEGSPHTVYNGELPAAPDTSPEGERLDSLDWEYLVPNEAWVTGGVTSGMIQTHRFSERDNYAMVLNRDAVPFLEVEYDLEWLDNHEGFLDHILSSSTGELHVTAPEIGQHRLYGSVEENARLNKPDETLIRHWSGDGRDYAMGMFSEEQEWLAGAKEVSLRGAIEGVFAWSKPSGIRVKYARDKDMIPGDVDDWRPVLPEVYETLREPLPEWTTFYLLVTDLQSAKNNSFDGWKASQLDAAYRDDGEIQPSAVPAKFRGAANR